MSDRPRDLKLELHEVVIAVKDVAGEQWYDLGLQLRLPTPILDHIVSYPVRDAHKRMMLGKWLPLHSAFLAMKIEKKMRTK